MHLEFETQFEMGNLVTLAAMAKLNPARCQAFSVEAVHFVQDRQGPGVVCYKLRPVDPPRFWGDGVMAVTCDRYVFGGVGLPEHELCELPEASRKFYAQKRFGEENRE